MLKIWARFNRQPFKNIHLKKEMDYQRDVLYGLEVNVEAWGGDTGHVAGLWGTREYASYKEVILGRFQVNDE